MNTPHDRPHREALTHFTTRMTGSAFRSIDAEAARTKSTRSEVFRRRHEIGSLVSPALDRVAEGEAVLLVLPRPGGRSISVALLPFDESSEQSAILLHEFQKREQGT